MRIAFKPLTSTLLILASFCLSAMADDTKLPPAKASKSKKPAAAVLANASGETTESTASVPRGRLPRYFAAIVNDEQRTAIYDIQSQTQKEVAALEQQLAALKAAEMTKIEALLSAAQRQQLEAMRLKASKKEPDLPPGPQASKSNPPSGSSAAADQVETPASSK